MRRRRWKNVIMVLLFLTGLSLVLYPSVSDHINQMTQSRAVMSYVDEVDALSAEKRAQLWQEAVEFNNELKKRRNPYKLPEELKERYRSTLNLTGNGMMGYVEIPAIEVLLPIYHGTAESVLQTAIGHVDWTFLPVGGEGTHSALSGHRGLPSARLFTDLDELMIGDQFMLQILDQTLTYEIDQILAVEPGDATSLAAVEGMDYCTLETCTPYGVNTHRMLVRGHRIENAPGDVRIVSEAMQIEPLTVAIALWIPMQLLLWGWLMGRDSVTTAREREKERIKAEMKQRLRR